MLTSILHEISDLREKLRISEENRKLLAVGAFVKAGEDLIQPRGEAGHTQCDHPISEETEGRIARAYEALEKWEEAFDPPLTNTQRCMVLNTLFELQRIEQKASSQQDGDRTESAPRSPVVEPSLWDPEAEKAADLARGNPIPHDSEANRKPQTGER
jgi:hypothetical protein